MPGVDKIKISKARKCLFWIMMGNGDDLMTTIVRLFGMLESFFCVVVSLSVSHYLTVFCRHYLFEFNDGRDF